MYLSGHQDNRASEGGKERISTPACLHAGSPWDLPGCGRAGLVRAPRGARGPGLNRRGPAPSGEGTGACEGSLQPYRTVEKLWGGTESACLSLEKQQGLKT